MTYGGVRALTSSHCIIRSYLEGFDQNQRYIVPKPRGEKESGFHKVVVYRVIVCAYMRWRRHQMLCTNNHISAVFSGQPSVPHDA